VRLAVDVGEAQDRCGEVVLDAHVSDLESHVAAVAGARIGQVGEDLLLRIEPHGSIDEAPEVDAIALAAEAKLDALVLVALAQDAIRDALMHEHPHSPLLEDPGAIGGLDLVTRPDLHDDAVDAASGEEMGEHEARGTCADDGDGDPRLAGHVRILGRLQRDGRRVR